MVDASQSLRAGLSATVDHVVEEADTAAAVGSGDLPVLATPRLLALAEQATCAAVAAALHPRDSSVGTRIRLEHRHPSPVGARVTVTATLQHVDGRLLRFDVVAADEDGKVVGHGEVSRVVVDRERFLGAP
ncbi:MAG: thioesterase [Actinomycetota bacterium]|nr:thioesterase [Actinomycetota bacterium]